GRSGGAGGCKRIAADPARRTRTQCGELGGVELHALVVGAGLGEGAPEAFALGEAPVDQAVQRGAGDEQRGQGDQLALARSEAGPGGGEPGERGGEGGRNGAHGRGQLCWAW